MITIQTEYIESILTSIKKLLGIPEEVKDFDQDVMMSINMALNTLTQLGVGPEEGFRIRGDEETWADFLGEDPRLESARYYVFLKTKLVFDPNQLSSSVLTEYANQIRELEWRLNVTVEGGDEFQNDG